MFAAITDCQVVLARGMGQGAYNGIQQMGIRPILTDIAEIETAVQAIMDGSIVNHSERLH
jgi:predicted Fe-Mo cluster-binding NifX family protein